MEKEEEKLRKRVAKQSQAEREGLAQREAEDAAMAEAEAAQAESRDKRLEAREREKARRLGDKPPGGSRFQPYGRSSRSAPVRAIYGWTGALGGDDGD